MTRKRRLPILRPQITAPRNRRPRIVVAARPTVSAQRVGAVAVVLVLVAGMFVYRLVDLQLTPDPRLQAVSTPLTQDPIAAPRGEIVDRVGRALALSLPTPTVIADPRLFAPEDVPGVVAQLAAVLPTPPEVLSARLGTDRAFAYLARQVDAHVGEAVAALDIPGIWLVEEPRRQNPNGACSGVGVIGRVDTDHNGISGLEKVRNEALQGVPGELLYEASADGSTIPGGREVVTPAAPGSELQLTLDRNVQYRAEQLLIDAVERAEATLGTVIISTPKTGEIVAMANVERSAETGDVDCTTTNHAVTRTFEPGSIMKPVTVAGVVESGVHGSRQELRVPYSILRNDGEDGHSFDDHWMHATESMTPAQIVANSSNVGTILLAEKLGAQGLFDTMVDFGLGESTSLGLPGEARGILDSLDTHALELANAAFGQGVSTTPIQMHQAFGALANRGVRIDPSIAVDDIDTTPGDRVVSERTASEVMDMMGDAVEYGTAQAAAVPGYEVAGKTGTAWQICPETGTYECGLSRHYTASFIGIVSNDTGPVLTITVIIDGSRGANYAGGSAAAPVFAELAGYTLRQLRIPPSSQPAAPSERIRAEAAVGPSERGDGA